MSNQCVPLVSFLHLFTQHYNPPCTHRILVSAVGTARGPGPHAVAAAGGAAAVDGAAECRGGEQHDQRCAYLLHMYIHVVVLTVLGGLGSCMFQSRDLHLIRLLCTVAALDDAMRCCCCFTTAASCCNARPDCTLPACCLLSVCACSGAAAALHRAGAGACHAGAGWNCSAQG